MSRLDFIKNKLKSPKKKEDSEVNKTEEQKAVNNYDGLYGPSPMPPQQGVTPPDTRTMWATTTAAPAAFFTGIDFAGAEPLNAEEYQRAMERQQARQQQSYTPTSLRSIEEHNRYLLEQIRRMEHQSAVDRRRVQELEETVLHRTDSKPTTKHPLLTLTAIIGIALSAVGVIGLLIKWLAK